MRSKTFYFLVAGFFCGATLGTFYNSIFVFFVILLIFFLFATLARSWIILAILCAIATGFFRANFVSENFHDQNRMIPFSEHIEIEAFIVSEPDRRDNTNHIVVEVDSTTPYRLKVIVAHFKDFKYGEKIFLRGVIDQPEPFETDLGRTFRYDNYLMKDKIHGVMVFPSVKILDGQRRTGLISTILDFKKKFVAEISEILPSPHAPLLSGILLGVKQAMGEDLLEAYRKVGLIHIVVLSGFNVTIIAEAIRRLLSIFNKKIRATLSITAMILFVIMVGAGPTIVRAGVMAALVVLARMSGNNYTVGRSLWFAGACMVFANPFILIHDPSFHLSFLATLGLIHVSPFVEERLRWLPEKFEIHFIVSATIATQIFVFPYMGWAMGEISIISLIVNVITLPFVNFVMLTGFLATVFSFFAKIIAVPWIAITYFLLEYQLIVVEFFAKVPLATVLIPKMGLGFLVSFYSLLASAKFFSITPQFKLVKKSSIY